MEELAGGDTAALSRKPFKATKNRSATGRPIGLIIPADSVLKWGGTGWEKQLHNSIAPYFEDIYSEVKILVTVGGTFEDVIKSLKEFKDSRLDVDWDIIVGWTGNDLVKKCGTIAIDHTALELLKTKVKTACKVIKDTVNCVVVGPALGSSWGDIVGFDHAAEVIRTVIQEETGHFVYNGAPVYGQLTKKAGDKWHFNRSHDNVTLFGEMFRAVAVVMNYLDHVFRPPPPAGTAGGDSRPVDQQEVSKILQAKSKQATATKELCKNTTFDQVS